MATHVSRLILVGPHRRRPKTVVIRWHSARIQNLHRSISIDVLSTDPALKTNGSPKKEHTLNAPELPDNNNGVGPAIYSGTPPCCTLLSLLEAVFLTFIKQVRLCTAKIDNLWTPVPVLLLLYAFPTVVRVRHTNSTTHDASSLEATIIAFVTYVHQVAGPDERVTDYTFSIA